MAVKLADIAEACGVDISTASRALRSDPRVNADTLERIQAKAKELGYRPNLLARSLAAGKTNTIAIMVNGLDPGPDNMLYNAASRHLQERGYMSMIMAHHGSMKQYERMMQQLGQGLVDGVILIAGDPVAQQSALNLLQAHIPVVCLDRGLNDASIPLITGGHEEAILHLIEKCRNEGVKTFIGDFGEHNTAARARSQVLKSALAEDEIIHLADLSRERLLTLNEPCAILVSSQHYAQSVVQEYPDIFKNLDYCVACFDAWQGDCFPAKKAFVAIQDFEAMALQAVELCTRLIDGLEERADNYTAVEVPIKSFETYVSSYA